MVAPVVQSDPVPGDRKRSVSGVCALRKQMRAWCVWSRGTQSCSLLPSLVPVDLDAVVQSTWMGHARQVVVTGGFPPLTYSFITNIYTNPGCVFPGLYGDFCLAAVLVSPSLLRCLRFTLFGRGGHGSQCHYFISLPTSLLCLAVVAMEVGSR